MTSTRREILKSSLSFSAAALAVGLRHRDAAGQSPVRLPERVRVAIIGLEGHYSEILRAAEGLPEVQVTAVAERDESLRRRIAGNRHLKDARVYEDYRDLLDREKIEVAAVCGQNGPRASIVQECAERKIAIVAEKPLALSIDELQKTRAVVSAANVPLTMLLPMRFSPPYLKMRSIVKSGEIGEVVSLSAQKSYKLGQRPDWMKDRKSFGGTIPYIGIHMVDLMMYIGGCDFTETAAFQSTVGFPELREMENNAVVIFRLVNRGSASLRMDYLRPETAPTHGDDRLRVAGTKGVVEYQRQELTLLTSGQKPASVVDLPPARLLVADFLQSLYGGPRHALSQEEVFRVSEIVLKAREAAETGRVIPL
jgi:predicted dehydrogenase